VWGAQHRDSVGVTAGSACGSCAPPPLRSHQSQLTDDKLDAQFPSSVLENLSLFSYLEPLSYVVGADPCNPPGFPSAPGKRWQLVWSGRLPGVLGILVSIAAGLFGNMLLWLCWVNHIAEPPMATALAGSRCMVKPSCCTPKRWKRAQIPVWLSPRAVVGPLG